MHDLLEGVVPQTIKLVLRTFIKSSKYFNCNMFNDRLNNFDYGPVESQDKPCANFSIQKLNEKGSKLKQTAAQTWVLLRVFPFIVNGWIPEQNDEMNLITVLQKNGYICFSNVTTYDMIDELELNINTLQKQFRQIFPDIAPINKLHHLSHYACNTRATSVPNDYSCMRFEVLNKLPKNQMKNAQNFMNVPLSLTKRLNLKQISAIVSRSYCRMDIISDSVVRKDYIQHKAILNNFPSNLYNIKHVVVDGINFKSAAVIKYDDDKNQQHYAVINNMYYYDAKLYFVVNCLRTVGFSKNFNSYHVTNTLDNLLIPEERIYKRKTYSIWNPYSSDDCYIALHY